MARSKSNSFLTFIPIVLVVVGGSAVAGYYLGGGSHPSMFASPTNQTQPSPVPTTTPSSAQPSVKVATAKDDKADYTAPDAPDIQITEVKQPKLSDASSRPASKIIGSPSGTASQADPEASQQATPQNTSADTQPDGSNSTDTTSTTNTTSDQTPTDQTTTSDNGDSNKGDYEKIIEPPDSEASQQGAVTPAPKPTRFTYRVQTGSFAVARNARILADALRGRGYDTSLTQDTQGDQTVYRVQTGAYQSKSAANAAADALRASGYPATVSPITPD